MPDLQLYLDTAVEAARIAGAFQRYRFTSALIIDLKGDKDLVTEVDRESERLIVEHLRSKFPGHDIVAEEGQYPQGGSPFRWIIDPVDGTTNYAHGFPWFCSSIGLMCDEELVAAVIYNPVQDELFTATRGGGSFLNARRISVSCRAPLKNSLLGTGFPYDCASDPANNFDNFITFQKATRGIRRAGAAALDLAYVAAGRYDGYWERGIYPWDVAAGLILVREAGGFVSAIREGDDPLEAGAIVAGNGALFEGFRDILRGPGAPTKSL